MFSKKTKTKQKNWHVYAWWSTLAWQHTAHFTGVQVIAQEGK